MDIVYEALKKVPGITDTEAHEVASKISQPDKDMATKADIKDMVIKADIKDMATKEDIANLKENMATKADLAETKNSMIMWIIGVGIFLAVAIFLK